MMRSESGSRPAGRLFCWLMTALLACGVLHARAAEVAPATTQVRDVVYRANGTPAQGTALISWPTFVTADKKTVVAGTTSVKLGEGGLLNVALAPNTGATPGGTYYKVVMKLDDGTTTTEYWNVPDISPATIAAIRTTLTTATSPLEANVVYVNAAEISSEPLPNKVPRADATGKLTPGWLNVAANAPISFDLATAALSCLSCEVTTHKDAAGGYVGLDASGNAAIAGAVHAGQLAGFTDYGVGIAGYGKNFVGSLNDSDASPTALTVWTESTNQTSGRNSIYSGLELNTVGGTAHSAIEADIFPAHTTGTMTRAVGVTGFAEHRFSGITNSLAGVSGAAGIDSTAGHVRDLIGLWAPGNYGSATGEVDSNYGLKIDSQAGVGAKSYGVYVANQGQAATDYAIYTAGGHSYFGGPLDAVQTNGIVNATTMEGADIAQKANAAFASCMKHCKVVIPAGDYANVTTTIAYPMEISGNATLEIDGGAFIHYTGNGCFIEAAATEMSNANNVTILNYGQIIGSAAGKAGICLGPLNKAFIRAGDIHGFSNAEAHADRGWGSGIFNDGANTVVIEDGNLRWNRVGLYCAVKNTSFGGFGCIAQSVRGTHLQANSEWGAILDGDSAVEESIGLALWQSSFTDGTVIEGNATSAAASIAIDSISRAQGIVTLQGHGACSVKPYDYVRVAGAGASWDGTFQVLSKTGACTITYRWAGANGSTGAAGTMQPIYGGLIATNAPGLAVHAYFEGNGAQQDIVLGDSNSETRGADVSNSTFASDTTPVAIQLNSGGVSVRNNVAIPSYTNLVKIAHHALTGIRVEDNSEMMTAEVLSETGVLPPDLAYRANDGGIRAIPPIQPAKGVASRQSPPLTFCGNDSGGTTHCSSVSAFLGGEMQISPEGHSTYFGGPISFGGGAEIASSSAVELKAGKGAANGYASLDASAKIPVAQLPSITNGMMGAASYVKSTIAGFCMGTASTSTAVSVAHLGATATGCTTTAAANVGYVVPSGGTIKNLYISEGTSHKGGGTLAWTVQKCSGGSCTAQALTCTVASGGTTCNDQTHSVSVSAGDVIQVKSASTASSGETLANVSVSMELWN